jgi:predicted SprT family Zn-dependent metalloprotease
MVREKQQKTIATTTETVLITQHEMIHAYLFITNGDRSRDGHGANFIANMERINKVAGTNITVFHNFHDEVNSHRLHWWKCQGKCGFILKRAMNRAPAPMDYWWPKVRPHESPSPLTQLSP